MRLPMRAEQIGERFGDADLVWLAHDDQARALLALGRANEGLRLVDEALVAAASGELSPIVTGIVYCNTIAFCRAAHELRHVRVWTEALTEWCDRQPEMVAHNGLCLVHRAEIMMLQGALDRALDEARQSVERFSRGVLNQIALGNAHYCEGEVHRLRGDHAAAEEAYRQAGQHGFEPQPGLSLLRLAQGKTAAAAAAMRRVIGETTAGLSPGRAAAGYVEIMLADGEVERAPPVTARRVHGEHRERRTDRMAAQTRGAVALVTGDPRGALADLRALGVWVDLAARYEVAARPGAHRSRMPHVG